MRRALPLLLLLASGAVALVTASASASAADGGKAVAGALRIELNRLEQTGSACRVTLVTANGFDTALDELAVEVVLFDAAGLVARMTALGLGALPAGKTIVKRFDMADMACAGVSRILVNGVAACRGEGLDGQVCGQALATGNRTGIVFGR